MSGQNSNKDCKIQQINYRLNMDYRGTNRKVRHDYELANHLSKVQIQLLQSTNWREVELDDECRELVTRMKRLAPAALRIISENEKGSVKKRKKKQCSRDLRETGKFIDEESPSQTQSGEVVELHPDWVDDGRHTDGYIPPETQETEAQTA